MIPGITYDWISFISDESVEDQCKDMRSLRPHTSCVLYGGQKCNGKEGLKELSNGANLFNVKEMLDFDVESVSVRDGCQLTLYTGPL